MPTSSTSLPPQYSSFARFSPRAVTDPTPQLPTRRPWLQLLSISSFSRPYTLGETILRIKLNVSYFRLNYTLIALSILFISLIWHPVSMIVFLVAFVAWYFFYLSRDEPVMVFNRVIDERLVLILLGVLTIVALGLTHVWLNVLVSVSIAALMVCLHGALRSTDDLYNDEEAGVDGWLESVVGSPRRSGYTRI